MSLGLAPLGVLSMTLVAAKAIAGILRRTGKALVHRGAVHRLSYLDDRALKDIGLTRNDVEGALAQPLHVNPSEILALRRGRPRMAHRPTLTIVPCPQGAARASA